MFVAVRHHVIFKYCDCTARARMSRAKFIAVSTICSPISLRRFIRNKNQLIYFQSVGVFNYQGDEAASGCNDRLHSATEFGGSLPSTFSSPSPSSISSNQSSPNLDLQTFTTPEGKLTRAAQNKLKALHLHLYSTYQQSKQALVLIIKGS